MAVKIQLRNDLASVWTEVNPILMEGEIGLETNTRKIKIGDGESAWTSLSYVTQGEEGRAIEYEWRGTELGIRSEGELEFKYVDLRDRTNSDEIMNARGESENLGIRLDSMDTERERVENKADRQHADVSRELRSHKQATSGININQEATQTAEGRRLVSLPKTAGEGHGQFGLKGLTATNLVDNDNLPGLYDYSTSQTPNSSELLINGKKTRKVVGSMNSSRVMSGVVLDTHFNLVENKKYILYVQGVPTGESYVQIVSSMSASTGFSRGNTHQIPNVIGTSVVKVIGGQDRKHIGVYVGEGTTYLGNFHIVEITEDEYDNVDGLELVNKYGHFEGTQSVNGSVRVKSVGKNLFDKSDVVLGEYFRGDGEPVYVVGAGRTNSYIKTHKGERYISNKRSVLYTYDEDKKPIKRIITTANLPFFLEGSYFRISSEFMKNELDLLQIERGSTPTPYEPYTESTQYLNAPKLRSLPNGVADEIRPDGRGGYEVVRRVGVMNASKYEYWYHHPAYTDADKVGLFTDALPDASGGMLGQVRGTLNGTLIDNYAMSSSDFIIGRPLIFIGSSKVINIRLPYELLGITREQYLDAPNKDVFVRGLLQNLDTFLIHYQLAEPIITPLNTSGELITRPSGTVYVEDVVADVATYSNKATVGRTELLIKELDKLSVMDFETGDERDLDVSKAVISTDKLSFTHPDLTNNDIVFFEYCYTEESTDGLASIEYFDSRYTIKDSITDKHYKWSIAIADGVPSIELEEV